MGKGAVQGAADGMISGMVSGAFAGAAMSMSGNPMFCFVAGTTVLTTLGKKAIEIVKVGDTIPCVDHITGETTEKKVLSTTVHKINRLIELDIDGECIRCTETHLIPGRDYYFKGGKIIRNHTAGHFNFGRHFNAEFGGINMHYFY